MKRFYTQASVIEVEDGWQVHLDNRALKTVGGAPQIVPRPALAEAMAAEWQDQGEEIVSSDFVLRDMADYALDIVRADPAEPVAKLIGYAETDTLCYRADPDEALYKRQQEVWEPILTAFERREGIVMQRISGIVHRPQPEESLAALRGRVRALDPFAVAALEQLTSLAASLSLGLSALEPDADIDGLWAAAQLEEDWQADLWGREEEAEERRAARLAAFKAAADFARLARG